MAAESPQVSALLQSEGAASLGLPESHEEAFPVTVQFDAANAPVLKKRSLKFKSDVRVLDVQRLLQEKIGLDSVVLVVDKCFTPLPDQDLGSLFRSFGRNGALHITYGVQAVFG